MTETPHFATFGEVLKAFRKRRGLTQQQLATAIGMHRNAISRWEQGDFLPESKVTVLELAKALRLDYVETQNLLTASFMALAPLSNVPYQRNPLFTGREACLQTLHQHLSADQMVTLTQSYAVHGLGGIGKTQLAIEYTYRYALEYTAVLWMQAESVENITTSFLAIAELLQLPACQYSRQQQVIAAVQRWLSTHSRWLMIWDNLEEIELLQRYLPVGHQGKVLITTRCQVLGPLVQGLELPTMTQEEGVLFLLRRAKVMESLAGDQQVQQVAQRLPEEYAAAEELVQIMGGLPLALDQAGAYIEETGCGLAAYLQLYKRQRKQLLERRGTSWEEHPQSTVATFALAYQRVEELDPAAAELLCLCAFLHPDDIPEELIEAGAECLQEPLRHVVKDLYQFNQAIATLRTLSLVRRSAETRALSVHRLVQVVLRELMDPSTYQAWVERIVRVVNAAFPNATGAGAVACWSVCQRYLAHVEVCAHLIQQCGIGSVEAAGLLNRAGDYLRERAQYEQAKFSHILLNVAYLYMEQGKYKEAEQIFGRALDIYKQQGLLELPQAAATLSELGMLRVHQDRYAEAEQLFLRALCIREQQLGTRHPDIALTLDGLAVLSARLGRQTEAEALFRRILAIREWQLDPMSPMIAVCLYHLAELYLSLERYEEAEPLLLRALSIDEQSLGADHLAVAAILSALGTLSLACQQDERARVVLRRALTIREQHLGAEHPDTAKVRATYQRLHEQEGKR